MAAHADCRLNLILARAGIDVQIHSELCRLARVGIEDGKVVIEGEPIVAISQVERGVDGRIPLDRRNVEGRGDIIVAALAVDVNGDSLEGIADPVETVVAGAQKDLDRLRIVEVRPRRVLVDPLDRHARLAATRDDDVAADVGGESQIVILARAVKEELVGGGVVVSPRVVLREREPLAIDLKLAGYQGGVVVARPHDQGLIVARIVRHRRPTSIGSGIAIDSHVGNAEVVRPDFTERRRVGVKPLAVDLELIAMRHMMDATKWPSSPVRKEIHSGRCCRPRQGKRGRLRGLRWR